MRFTEKRNFSKEKKAPIRRLLLYLLVGDGALWRAVEQEFDAPQAAQTNDDIHDARAQSSGPTENPSDQVEGNRADQKPVDCADDDE